MFPKDQQKRKWETYFKFTFVREPFERILSAYKDKFVYPRFPRPMLQYHGRENSSSKRFQERTW